MAQFNINTDAVVVLTNKLEKLHRSALPVAIRTSLNSVAFNVKEHTSLTSAASEFTQRKKTFFKQTRVTKAKGFNLNSMKSVVGFIGGEKNQAIRDLEQQESGGSISGRSFIPVNSSRISRNKNKNVRPRNKLKNIKNIVNAKKVRGANSRQKFVKSVIHAGVGGFVLSDFRGKRILWRVNSLNKTDSGSFKLTALYSYVAGRKVKVNNTNFMAKASLKSNKKMVSFYEEEAKKQVKRLMR